VESSMTLSTIAGMFSTMIALAIVPDASALAVTARSISSGFKHGLVVVIGIVFGDFIFVMLAVFSLSAIVEVMGELFIVIKYLGAAYLVCLGLLLFKAKQKTVELEGIEELSWRSDFLCGFFITLGDPKAILFYMSLLPAFIDLSSMTIVDVGIIMATSLVALCCTKLIYAFMAAKSGMLFKSSKSKKRINILAGSVMIATGLFLVIKI
jgi:threonine/homoserine/homoserine lactone efflux protein